MYVGVCEHVGTSVSTEKICGVLGHWEPAMCVLSLVNAGASAESSEASTKRLLGIPRATLIPFKGNLNLYKSLKNPLLPLPASLSTKDLYLYFIGEQRTFHGYIKTS